MTSDQRPGLRPAEPVADLAELNETLQQALARCTESSTAVQASEAEWRQLVETMPQIVWITRPDGWHLHLNQQWLDCTGRTLEESIGHG